MDSGGLDFGALLDMVSKNPELIRLISGLVSGAGKSNNVEDVKPASTGGDLSGLLGLLGGKQNEHKSSGIFSEPEENRKRIVLLNAVRPYLNDKRRDILDTVIKIMKLSELGGLSSLLGRL